MFGSDMAMRTRSAWAYECCRYRYGHKRLLHLARSLYPPNPDHDVYEFFFALLDALAATGTAEAEDFLRHVIQTSKEPEHLADGILIGAIIALTYLGGERAGDLLRPFIDDPSSHRRMCVFDAFERIGGHDDDIARFLDDPDEGIRLHAQLHFSGITDGEGMLDFFRERNRVR